MTHQAKRQAGIPPLEYANLAKAWLFVYAVLYFSAVIQGMRTGVFTPMVSAIFLVLMGVLSLIAVFVENRVLRILLFNLFEILLVLFLVLILFFIFLELRSNGFQIMMI